MNILDELGVDQDDFSWQELAVCQYLPDETKPLQIFFEDYLADENTRRIVDAMCETCPVRSACLDEGITNGEWGVYGGEYLEAGERK